MRSRKLRAEIARKTYKISGISALRAHKICAHSADVRCANLRTSLHLFTESEVRCTFKKNPSDAPRSRKSSAKLARNHCKIPRILARRGQRSCLKSASMRCVIQTTSLQLLNGSAVRPNAKKWRVWHRCHANFVPKSREKIAKFPDFRRVACTKTA